MSEKKGFLQALFGKKKKEACCSCCCGAASHSEDCGDASILILGSGCANCQTLEANTRAALAALGDDSAIGHVTDFTEIAKYGVMSTPGLVVDGKVLSSGRVLKTEEIIALLKKARG